MDVELIAILQCRLSCTVAMEKRILMLDDRSHFLGDGVDAIIAALHSSCACLGYRSERVHKDTATAHSTVTPHAPVISVVDVSSRSLEHRATRIRRFVAAQPVSWAFAVRQDAHAHRWVDGHGRA